MTDYETLLIIWVAFLALVAFATVLYVGIIIVMLNLFNIEPGPIFDLLEIKKQPKPFKLPPKTVPCRD